ncbi:MAG TPA: tRNA-dihydrouridine synthase family protein [Anaerolineales bacterium]|nr:tRNA-dihydrouridine synthase family protein [Anaerolineales bacterium]
MIFLSGLTIPGDTILAPMDGFSDMPFRSVCRELGSAASYTEFVNAIDVVQRNRGVTQRVAKRVAFLPQERPVGFQLFDNDPDRLLEAALRLMERQPDFIDINLGCSDRSVSGRGAGAGLLRTPERIAEIFCKMTARLPVPVTAKMRLGWDDASLNYLDVAKIVEDNGGALLAVHARTKKQGYGGMADWQAIAEICQAVSIPVVGNGDVRRVADIDRLKAATGCQAVMIGRAAVGNPWIFQRVERADVPKQEVLRVMRLHLSRSLDFFGEYGLVLFRKHASRYLSLHAWPEELRKRLMTATEAVEFLKLVEENL